MAPNKCSSLSCVGLVQAAQTSVHKTLMCVSLCYVAGTIRPTLFLRRPFDSSILITILISLIFSSSTCYPTPNAKMHFNIQALALLALSQVVTAQKHSPSDGTPSIGPHPAHPTSFITGVPAPSPSHGNAHHSPGSGKPFSTSRLSQASAKTASSAKASSRTENKRSSKAPVPTMKPVSTGLPGLTTTIYVTATILNQIEVISICPTSGAVTTVFEQSASCETYTTCVTIPASLCSTFVSTKDSGELTTCTTPVETWTQILTSAVTSTVVKTVTAGAAGSQPQATSAAGAQGVSPPLSSGQADAQGNTGGPSFGAQAGAQGLSSPASGSPAPAQTTYVKAGAGRFVVSSLAVCLSLCAFALT